MDKTGSVNSVAVIIVTWNSSRDIEACLASVYSQDFPAKEVVIVDNASNDNTVELVEKNYPQALLIKQDKNLGFAAANNIGIESIESDWIFTLNPDAFPAQDYLKRLIGFAEDKPGIGSVSGKLLRYRESDDDPQIIDSSGISIYRSRRVCDRGNGEVDQGQWEKTEKIFGVCAAAGLYRRSALEDVKTDGEVFPSYFFSYYEDADLAWRLWRRNWDAWYIPQAVCIHRRGGSPVGSSFSRFLTHRNRTWMILRNEPIIRTVMAQPEISGHEFLMMLRVILYPDLFRAVFQALTGISRAVNQRKRLEEKKRTPPPFLPGIGFSRKRRNQAYKTALIKGKNKRD